MLKHILSFLGAMKTMAVLMLIFAVAIGVATFIENDFGTQSAKAEVFNARWFEVLLALLAVNLALNIFNFKMYRADKALVLMFHISFFVVLIGAAITRYVGYEGVMHIREGADSNTMLSSQSYLNFVFSDNDQTLKYDKPIYLSKMSKNDLRYNIEVNGKEFEAELIDYIPDATYTLENVSGGKPTAKMMVTSAQAKPEQITLSEGEFYSTSDYVLDFESGKNFELPVIRISKEGANLKMSHPMKLTYVSMDDRSSGDINASGTSSLESRHLYSAGQSSFVLRQYFQSAKKVLVSQDKVGGPKMNGMNPDALILRLSYQGESKELTVMGTAGSEGEIVSTQLAGMNIELSYGAKVIELPFSLKLVDFQLERYPGSNSPSSYASEVILYDKEQGIEMPFRIYMNHILDHRNFRFFQSSYDRDEMGTVLSVNHDPGTLPTYLGYLLMGIGMFGSLLMRNGRFAKLSKKAKEAAIKSGTVVAVLAVALSLMSTPSQAEALNPIVKRVMSFDKDHAEKFGRLMVQDAQGRMKPMDTLSNEILAKVSRSSSLLGLSPNQIVLGMMLSPDAWREISMIRTAHKEVNSILGIDENTKLASFSQFFEFPSEMAGYKLNQYVEEAIRKAPAKRNKFDKAVLQIDERVNVAYMVYTGSLMAIWPAPNDANHKWEATIKALQTFDMKDAEIVRLLAVSWFDAIEKSIVSGNWEEADKALNGVSNYQRKVGEAIYPQERKIDIEILYNKLNIFEKLWPYFFLVGFILLILSFAKIIKPKIQLALITKISMILLILFFVALTLGLAMRWYISGHAPWSNGYESLVYISWATLLAGFIFSKNSPITLAATGIMTGLILFVAHLSWMDPQVTNLVPVLKSYWLSIHVSMITASYGFLGLGALLGFITLILFIIKSPSNEIQISHSIRELNAINEMSLMIGLVLLTIGNFLGGVWANESWGRYWGWDPKETWALVTILVYAVVIHVRFIKPIYTAFSYSVISLLAFTSVLMTYFGVNYYLAGMHSYAKGDPVPVPDFVPITYGIVFVIIVLAYRKRHLA
jgi:cytochrome c-type biogenesis protein CcsB